MPTRKTAVLPESSSDEHASVTSNGVPQEPEATVTVGRIEVPRINIQEMELVLIGDSPLICHRWSEKAKQQMLNKQMKRATEGKAAKDPQKDYEDSLYHHPDGGYGFPCIAFKNAGVSACRFTDGLKMTEARGAFHVMGEMVQIHFGGKASHFGPALCHGQIADRPLVAWERDDIGFGQSSLKQSH